ncbi:MAG: ribonuclease D [Gammaproteobacteria bacterium]|nr:ribonuclease D [Gammaproteobacteria bacterium]
MSASNQEYDYIDSNEALAQLCQSLSTKPYIAIDTEFLRERTYRPELCLVQIKQEEILACVDTQAITELGPLIDLMNNASVTKVFHAASQDCEIFYLLSKKAPAPLFDTQIAAPLLGYNEQIGYGNLVKEHLGIELSKSQTRADWTRRPLTDQQIMYALDDVIYLEQLYLSMMDTLTQQNRLSWLEPEFRAWEQADKYDQPAGDRWLKVRNIQRFKGSTLSIIQSLCEWREIKARELNKPRNWIMKDDVLISLAQQQPDSVKELEHIRGLDRKTRERHHSELLSLIDTARQTEPHPLPPFKKKTKLSPAKQALIQLMSAWVQQRAIELNINSAILAPPKLLEQLVTSGDASALSGWRTALIGDELLGLSQGQLSLRFTGSGLVLEPVPETLLRD